MSDDKAFTQDAAIRESLDQQHDDAIRAQLRAEIAQEIVDKVDAMGNRNFLSEHDHGIWRGLTQALRIVEGNEP